MNNILLIIEREYLERVTKKSFLIVTLLMPVIMLALLVLPAVFAQYEEDRDGVIYVIDDSGWFGDGFEVGDFETAIVDFTLAEATEKLSAQKADVYGVLFIPKMELDDPTGIQLYSQSGIGFSAIRKIENQLKDKVRELRIKSLNLDEEIIDQLSPDVSISTFNVSDDGESKEMDNTVASVLGYIIAFMIYMFTLVYGAFIMQSVLSEKTSKIVEIIISSVRPIDLMLGKVLGVAAVAFTQIIIWIVLLSTLIMLTSVFFGYSPEPMDPTTVQGQIPEQVQTMLDMVHALPLVQIAVMFTFYFLGGLLLYGGLFAAVGSSVDSVQEAQQFSFPLSFPIIISIMVIPIIGSNPDGTTAMILSMIPFTSPVLMMARIPFGVPLWQLVISGIILIGSVFGSMWLAGRIYRIGILSTGTKVSYKTLFKWIRMN